jgi:hypothetical protein
MKKKGNRSIPDFSRKRPQSPSVQDQRQNAAAPPPQAVRSIKPRSTSAKSGRRGS